MLFNTLPNYILQIKTQNQIKLYALVLISVLFLGAISYAFSKTFRVHVNDYVKNHKFFLATFLSFYLLYLVSRLFYPKTFFLFLFDEDGVFEYLTTVFFLIAAFFFAISLSKRNTVYIKVFIFALIFACFFVGMEEISWGQRILGIETPESFKEINYQEETTLHNLVSPKYHPFIYLVISIFCLVFFAFKNNRKYDYLFWVHKDFLPSKKFLMIALLLPLISWYNMEHFEVILSFLFCVYAYQLYQQKKESAIN